MSKGRKYVRPLVLPNGTVVGYLDRWGQPHPVGEKGGKK